MNLPDVRQGLADAVDTIDTLRVYPNVPEAVEPPCALISLGAGLYDDDIDGMNVSYGILVLLSRVNDSWSQDALDEYLSTDGAQSIPAAVRNDETLGGACDSAKVVGWSELNTYNVADVSYLGVEIDTEVIG